MARARFPGRPGTQPPPALAATETMLTSPDPVYRIRELTAREREVVRLAADDLGVLAIARKLGVSPATVRTHFANAYMKLEVRTRAGAVAKALRVGLIS